MAAELNKRMSRKTYLVTYSQADESKFPTRQSFADAVVEGFSQGKSKQHVVQWVCSKEEHQDTGFHYHLAIKLSGNKCWMPTKRYLIKKHGIVVHFAKKKHHDYYSAYRYVTKEDG